jgi:hypothetical protein
MSTRAALKTWLKTNSPDADDEDPPAKCKLTDLSLGGCYLETPSPFPVRARVELNMRVNDLEVHATGVVRVMHPDFGMGVIFTQKTAEQREEVEKFIHSLMESNGAIPELFVQPDGLEPFSQELIQPPSDTPDPLVELFQTKSFLPTTDFLKELRKQRRSETVDEAEPILPA